MSTARKVHLNLPVPILFEEVLGRREGKVTHSGSLVVNTGKYTGRSPEDKFIVREPTSTGRIWWGPVNRPFDPERFDALYRRIRDYLKGKDIFVQECFSGADPEYRIPVRVISETAWHSLFAHHLFLCDEQANRPSYSNRLTVVCVPRFQASPEVDGTNSETFILVNFGRNLILIGGTSYAGEIKKSVFTALNYLLPQNGILSMHCSANVGTGGDVALFFGLSGTGKTTLSTDPDRMLVGDDEHGWSDRGVFNLEGGCYAKVIRLSREDEPQIFNAAQRFGAVLENVGIDEATREVDFDDQSRTENTRAAYPLSYIPGAVSSEMAGHPKNIFLLSADAFGVLPPVARLTTEQTMYYFLSGYTAKVAGTERGLSAEPQATFSTCFGAPFLPLPPLTYAKLLGERIARHSVQCWLINTGWIGGRSSAGNRMPIGLTRAIIRCALAGSLSEAPVDVDPIFGLQVPRACDSVPPHLLQPRLAWADGAAYDAQARKLAARFQENFKQFDGVSILSTG
ncbi:MAG: phosphoenolpyruvate carboxykinase (ATP) [Chloroflexi bacterium]|nr:phosphoenolpyruvate carboxykinase (ATP) [Chloroflexota bacterium]